MEVSSSKKRLVKLYKRYLFKDFLTGFNFRDGERFREYSNDIKKNLNFSEIPYY